MNIKLYMMVIMKNYYRIAQGYIAYARTAQDKSERIIVIMNTTAKIRGYKVPEIKGAQLLISNYGNREKTLLRFI